jgi:hypothetical protein
VDVEITDDVAKAALRVYVHHIGMPHDGMRAAIKSALPHLTQPVKDGLDGEYWTERFDVLTNAVDKLTDLFVDSRDEIERIRIAPEAVDEEAIFERGREVGRFEATVEPSDRETWRDAWFLSVGNCERGSHSNVLRENAEWFFDRLKAGPPGPPVPDCKHCGADSSMDHDEGCPSSGTLQTGQDDDGVPYSRIVPAERSGHAEPVVLMLCPHCKTIDGTHVAWCPKAERERSADQIDPDEDEDDADPTYQVVNPGTGETIHGLTREQYEAHPFKGATYPRTFPGVNPDGTGTGALSGRAGG